MTEILEIARSQPWIAFLAGAIAGYILGIIVEGYRRSRRYTQEMLKLF